ncbi:MAG TPA: hypothetical protein VF177_15780 [Anaerolineae bacterium]
MNWTAFRQQISDSFNGEELRTLCFDLNVDYDDLPGENKSAKVRELIARQRRNGRLPELITELKRRRPRIHWQSILPPEVADIESSERPVYSTTGFVGQTERGPLHPVFVTGWAEYQETFGSEIDPATSFLPLAVRGFFENGGQQAYIIRAVGVNTTSASLQVPAAGAQAYYQIEALNPMSRTTL